jgi:hypothetical protein
MSSQLLACRRERDHRVARSLQKILLDFVFGERYGRTEMDFADQRGFVRMGGIAKLARVV